MKNEKISYELQLQGSFDRNAIMDSMQATYPEMSEASLKLKFQQLLDEGSIVRVGRNTYSIADETSKKYSYQHTDFAQEIVSIISQEYPLLEYRIFELVQLNEFLNHQIAHNTVFVYVENELENFVFDTLKEKYPGHILNNPTPEMYHQYWIEDMVVIQKLATEAPKGDMVWDTPVEKFLVDVFSDKLLASTFSVSELPHLLENVFGSYVVNESRLFRYARRRGVEKRLKQCIKEKTDIILKTEKDK